MAATLPAGPHARNALRCVARPRRAARMRAMGTLNLAATGLQLASGIAGAAGEAKATAYKSAELAKAARYGKIAAAETDAQLREELSTVIGNIRSVRASAGVDPNSPTTQDIIANESRIAERQRRIKVGNLNAQAESDANASDYLKKLSGDQWLYGTIGALGSAFGSLSSAAASSASAAA